MAIQEDPFVASVPTRAAVAAPAPLANATGRAVPASHAVEWLSSGWRLFRRQAGIWILLALVFALLFILIGAIPILGQLAVTLLAPVFIAGTMRGCEKVERGEELELADLFAGFRRNTVPLVLVGLIGLTLMVVVLISVAVLTNASAMLAMISGNNAAAVGASAIMPGLLVAALTIPIQMAVWFAPPLVFLHGESAPRAMILSFQACLKNIVPFVIYGVLLFVLAIVATVPVLLGWLVLGPVLMGSVYAGYRDLFLGA